MAASESSAVVDAAAAAVDDNNKVLPASSDNGDVVDEGASAAKNIQTTHDDGKIKLDKIFNKSTSSSSKAIIDEENIQKAISFLCNNEIRDVSPSEKRRYLTTKGINQNEIDTAFDRLATSTAPTAGTDDLDKTRGAAGSNLDYQEQPFQHRQQQYQQQHQPPYGGPPPPHHYMQSSPHTNTNNMNTIRPEGGGDSSFFSFSSLAGGFCMSTFCLAAVRWLNGGDFVLFPPPVAGGRYIKQDTNEVQNEEDDDGETNADDHPDETSFNSHGSGDPDISRILNGTANLEIDIHGNDHQEQTSSFEDLVMEVKALSTTINSFREEQDRANRVATAQLGKGFTDDAMDFLRQQKPPVQKKGDVDAIDKKDVSRIKSLITEMVEELSQVKESLDDVAVVDKSDNENDGSTKAEQCGLSSKIDIAIGKGRDILALVQKPEERSSDQTVEIAIEQGNDEEDNDNTTKDEDNKDDEKHNPKPDQTRPADETSGESSDIKHQDSTLDIEEALKTLSQKNESGELKIGAQMLYLYCKNLSKNPTVPRYRKIYTNNNSFKKKVGNLVGVKDFLSALGFVERTNFFEWSDTSPDTKSQLDFALVALEQLQKGQVEDSEIARSDTSEEKSEK